MQRHFYSNKLEDFLRQGPNEILGTLAINSGGDDDRTQKDAWLRQIEILKPCLAGRSGRIFFEYSIPRLSKRVDVVLLTQNVLFVLEFKIGEKHFVPSAIDQVWDYGLDLKNFHETSHALVVAPVLVATDAKRHLSDLSHIAPGIDGLISPPLRTNSEKLGETIDAVLRNVTAEPIDCDGWDAGQYSPTPTIIEAATTLYRKHSVYEITRKDASAAKLRNTTNSVIELIERTRAARAKSICFITGVPGAGKTLVGLEIATKYLDKTGGDRSVFLSGNGPLVKILTEALARDKVLREKQAGRRYRIGEARSEVGAFVQAVHRYRDEYIKEKDRPPIDHVAIFDEAQRAWNLSKTADFMKRRKRIPDFNKSEPEFLISCLDRHNDWAVIVCLVGGGQEIYRGEAGIGEWIESVNRAFPHWSIYISDRLHDAEYAAGEALEKIQHQEHVRIDNRLHLSVSMRSYRAENVSAFVKAVLDQEVEAASELYGKLRHRYPVLITRNLASAKNWLRHHARGSERYGLVASSNAHRLKPHAINVKAKMEPVDWFLGGKDDVRSSYFLEDPATEFQIQGLELDWTCVTWDADFRYVKGSWGSFEFKGSKWQKVKASERQQYLKNAYRVLLTRARQGMVIAVPYGDSADVTRQPAFYDHTYDFLKAIGIEELT